MFHQRVSLILTTNGRESLTNAFKSCADQIYDLVEILVIDNGKEPAQKMLSDIEFSDKQRQRFLQTTFIRIPECHNPGLLRNVGTAFARGEYIAYCPDDGFFDPIFLDMMLDHSRQTDIADDLIMCRTTEVEGNEQHTVGEPLDSMLRGLLKRNLYTKRVHTGSFVVKTVYAQSKPWPIKTLDAHLTSSFIGNLLSQGLKSWFVDALLYSHIENDEMFSKISQRENDRILATQT